MKELLPINRHEGVAHQLEDIKKKWTGSTVIAIDAGKVGASNIAPVTLTSFDGNYCEYFNHGNLDSWTTIVEDLYIVKEFPPNGLINIPDGVFLLSRNDERQWHRGASNRTMLYDCLWGKDKNFGNLATMIVASFNFTPVKWELAIREVAKENPVVIDRRYWIIGDKSAFNLFFEDVFLGVVVDGSFIIPHDESVTLAEEAIHEFGLQKV